MAQTLRHDGPLAFYKGGDAPALLWVFHSWFTGCVAAYVLLPLLYQAAPYDLALIPACKQLRPAAMCHIAYIWFLLPSV